MEASRRNQGSLDLNIPHSASVALVSTSAVLCIFAVCIYCICIYCGKSDSDKADQPPTTHVSLPMSCYNRNMNVGTQGCVICLNEFEDGEGVNVIPACGHVFHSQCIDMWLAKQASCPVCRCEKMSSAAVEDETETGDEGERVGAVEVKVMA